MSSLPLPFVASVIGHSGVLAFLLLVASQIPPVPLPEPPRKPGIEVMLAPPEPVIETPPPAPEIPSVAETEPPPPEPPPAAEEVPPPPVAAAAPVAAVEPKPPPPPPKPVAHRPIAKPPPPHRPPPVRPTIAPRQGPMQTAAIPVPAPAPAPHPGPLVSSAYRAALSAWLESHKRYPDSARSRGEEGRAMLRFRVERSGRVLNYALVQSTGYPDLDAAIDGMMRGAALPPFPADMTASDVEVSVTVRFSLAR